MILILSENNQLIFELKYCRPSVNRKYAEIRNLGTLLAAISLDNKNVADIK